MKLTQLKSFLAVADTGSFSEAALDLNVSQAAVSYAVAELENVLAVRLFERGRFGAKLTEVGESIAVHARGLCQLERAVYQEADLSRGVVAGELRIVAFRSAAGKIVTRLISQLRAPYPDLQVRLKGLDDEGIDMVRERRADIAFVDGDIRDNGLINWEVMRDPYYALLNVADPREILSWNELTSATLIMSTGLTCGGQVLRYFESIGRTVKPAYEVYEDSTIAQMVAANLGIGILPAFAIDALPEGVKVVPTDVTIERSIYISLLPESLKLPVLRVFLNALRAAYPNSEIPPLELKPQVKAAV